MKSQEPTYLNDARLWLVLTFTTLLLALFVMTIPWG